MAVQAVGPEVIRHQTGRLPLPTRARVRRRVTWERVLPTGPWAI